MSKFTHLQHYTSWGEFNNPQLFDSATDGQTRGYGQQHSRQSARGSTGNHGAHGTQIPSLGSAPIHFQRGMSVVPCSGRIAVDVVSMCSLMCQGSEVCVGV